MPGEPHGAAGPIEEVRARGGLALNRGEPEPIVGRKILHQGDQPSHHALPLPGQLGAERLHCGVAPAAGLFVEPAAHLAAHPEREDGDRDQHRDGGGEEESSPEAHGASTGRRAPSSSTVSGGTPRRTTALSRVSISGIRVVPAGHPTTSRHGTSAVRGSATT